MADYPITAIPGLAALLALASCTASAPEQAPTTAAATSSPSATDRSYIGWYMEHGNEQFFQACGESSRRRVDSAELRSRAAAFGLGTDNPVYVRLRGTQPPQGSNLVVTLVESFGSATPIRDCPMTGVVIASPAGSAQQHD